MSDTILVSISGGTEQVPSICVSGNEDPINVSVSERLVETTQWDNILGTVKHIPFNLTPNAVPETAGTAYWNTVDGTISFKLLNGTDLQNGQELFFYGKASGAISNGDLCQFAGVQGDHILVKKAVGSEIDANPSYIVGIATQNIANGDYGYITWFGKVNGVYTTGWSVGDILYFDVTTGQLTNVMPTAPNRVIEIAAVIKTATGASENGILIVRPTFKTTAATNVTFSPSGSIVATNVQSAIEELDSETVKLTGDQAIAGNKTFTGNTILGDASTDTVTVSGYMGVGGASNAQEGLRIASDALSGTNQYGLNVRNTSTSSATGHTVGAYINVRTAAAAYTASSARGLWITSAIKGAGSTITNQHAIYIDDQTQGTNNYGITSTVSSGTNKWNIYALGTAANYFAGNLLIGTTTDMGTNLLVGGAGAKTFLLGRTDDLAYYRMIMYGSTGAGGNDGRIIMANNASTKEMLYFAGTSGNILIGTTTDDGVNKLQVNGGIAFAPSTTTTAPAAGGAGALPATPLGYATITINGTARKIAYYA